MRPVRILLVAIALVAVGLAGWALGARGGYGQPGADPSIAESPSIPDDQVAQDEGAGGNTPSVNAPSGGNGSSGGSGSSGGPKPTPTTKPRPPVKATPKPSFEGLGTIPDSPHIGTALHLPPAPGEVIFVLDIANATRAQFWLAPTGTAVSDQAVWLGEDRNGRNGWTARWRYTEEVPLAHLIVRATGPGGTAEEFFPVTNNGGMDPTEEVAEEVTEEQKP
jgi:hypothetical protein